MNKKHAPQDGFDQMLEESLKQNYKVMKERDNQDYDGVLGEPPECVPEWASSFFRMYRNRLMDVREYTHESLLNMIELYMNEYFRERDTGGVEISNLIWPSTYPNGKNIDLHCFRDEIGFIAWIKWCVDQGEKICVAELSGNNGELGLRISQSNARFGKVRGTELHEERAGEWKKWIKEKDRLIKVNPHLAINKSELARHIKENLNLKDSVSTIRQRI